ncbi:MAG: GNAT family N-acetyltransferase [Flavobacteriales bacterium]|nr:GNAT family N-acetyltransferase [Flavobacteriales bacterium]
MKISHGNTVLRSLENKDLERVRSWRNNESVNQHLLNREYISIEAQAKWFENIDAETSLYCIAEESGVPFGLIYATEINKGKRTFWGNVLVGEPAFRSSALPVKAVVMLMWYFLENLGFETCFSKVATSNSSALQLNQRLGFLTFKKEGGLSIQRCERALYHSKAARFWKPLLAHHQIRVFQSELDL